MEFISRFFDPPESNYFLLGPRGTGKSTWLTNRYPGALLVDLLDPQTYRQMKARPERLIELLDGSPAKRPIVIDEIQRVPELLQVAHARIESVTRDQFVFTGSSARKIRRSGTDLLAGRAINYSLHPFMAAELEQFDLDSTLRTGLIPLVTAAPDPQTVLKAYATLYLEEEVKAEGWARNVGDFARFLEVISFSHAAVLNVSNIAREAGIKRKTVNSYVEVLEDLLLAVRIPVFSKRAKRATSVHPKFYYFDAGVYRSLRPAGPLDRPEEIEGAALEGLVLQHLRAWIDYSRADCKLYFWRTASGVEIDFVVYGAGGFWGIEVKNSANARPTDVKALASFCMDYPECTPILLYRGAERLKIQGVWCVPVESFLHELVPKQSLEAWVQK